MCVSNKILKTALFDICLPADSWGEVTKLTTGNSELLTIHADPTIHIYQGIIHLPGSRARPTCTLCMSTAAWNRRKEHTPTVSSWSSCTQPLSKRMQSITWLHYLCFKQWLHYVAHVAPLSLFLCFLLSDSLQALCICNAQKNDKHSDGKSEFDATHLTY